MKNILMLILFICSTVFASKIEFSKEELEYIKNQKTITVSSEPDYEPLDFTINNQPSGYSIDLLELLLKDTGLQIKYKTDTWTNLYEDFKAGKIDLIHTMFKNQERSKFVNYSQGYLAGVFNFVVKKSAEDNYFELKDLYGKKVGVTKNWYQETIMKDHPQIKRVYYNNLKEKLNALLNNEIDTIINDKYIAQYFIKKYGYSSLIKVSNQVKGNINRVLNFFHFATLKTHPPELISIINKSLQNLDIRSHEQLLNKWFGKNNEFTKFSLTNEEKAYLKEKKVLRFPTYQDWQPFNFLDKNEPKGYIVDLTKIITKKLGLDLQFVNGYNWPNHMKMLKENKVDLIGNMVYNEQRAKTYNFSDKSTLELLSGMTSFNNYKNMEDIKDKILGIQRNSIFDSFIKKYYPNQKIKYYDSLTTLLSGLINHEVDAFLENYAVTKYFINNTTLFNQSFKINIFRDINISNLYMYFATNKNEPILTKLINKAYNNLTNKDLALIKLKWDMTSTQTNQYSQKEIKYIKNNTFNLCLQANNKKMNYLENNELKGIYGEIYKEISIKSGLKFNYIDSTSDDEFYEKIANNTCDMITVIPTDQTRFKNIKSSNIVAKNQLVAISTIKHNENINFKNHNLLAPSSSIVKLLKNNYPNLKISLVKNIEDIKNLIEEDYNTIGVFSNTHANDFIENYGYDKFKVIHKFPDLTLNSSLGINQNNPLLLSIINKTLNEIGTDKIEKIYRKYEIESYTINRTSYEWLFYIVVILISLIIIIQSRYLYLAKQSNKEERIYREILEHSVSKIAFIDNHYKYKKINTKYANLIGKKKNEIENHYMVDVLGVEYFNKNLKEKIDIALLGNEIEFEVQYKDKIILANYAPYYEKESNRVIGVIFNLLNITDKKESEEKQKELMIRLTKAQDIGQLGAWKYDVIKNKFTLTGIVAKLHDIEILKAIDFELLLKKAHKDDISKMQEALENTLKNKKAKKELIYRVYKNDEIRYMEVKWEHILDDEGNIIGLDGVGQDITQKTIQDKELKNQEEIMYQQSRLAQLGEMIAMIAHQWRQPLNTISFWNASILKYIEKTYQKDEKIETITQNLSKQIQYMDETIENFKSFYKPNKEKSTFNIHDSLNSCLEVIKPRIHSHNINIINETSNLNIFIHNYEGEFKQVFLVLFNNAIDAMNNTHKKDLIINCKNNNKHVIIEIKDTGHGIKDEDKEKIFQAYFSTKSLNGTGLGLYMIKTMIDRSLKGFIEFESSNEGTIFKVKLPITTKEEDV